jgi:hypothetical protein
MEPSPVVQCLASSDGLDVGAVLRLKGNRLWARTSSESACASLENALHLAHAQLQAAPTIIHQNFGNAVVVWVAHNLSPKLNRAALRATIMPIISRRCQWKLYSLLTICPNASGYAKTKADSVQKNILCTLSAFRKARKIQRK